MPATFRQIWITRTSDLSAKIKSCVGGWIAAPLKRTTLSFMLVSSGARLSIVHLQTRKKRVITSFLLLLMPALLVFFLARGYRLEAYDDFPVPEDRVVAALLRGEQLIPPPPLPPELFLTKEVEIARQELGSASREWMKLDDDFRQRLLTAYQLMAKHGYQMVLLEGYRSPERQAMLARLGSNVTNAGPYQSYHQYGLAADSAFLRDGKIVISEKDPWAMEGYRLFGEYAESTGLVWGGRWKMMDFGHVELRKRHVLGKQ